MAASNYPSPILDFTLKFEGGWSDNSADPGGATMKGVTKSRYEQFKGHAVTKAELRAISDAELQTIYRTGYWQIVAGDALASGPDLPMFDIAVNSGPGRALQWWKACPSKGDAIAAAKWLCARRRSFWQGLGTFNVFGKGWLARGAACEALALKLATGAAATVVLAKEAKATKTKRNAGTAAGGTGTAAATQSPDWTQSAIPEWLLILLGLGLAIGAAALVYFVIVHHVRAKAMTTEAQAA